MRGCRFGAGSRDACRGPMCARMQACACACAAQPSQLHDPRPIHSQGVSGQQMLRLTDTDLIELGLTDVQSRSNLLMARDTLLAPVSVSSQQAPGSATSLSMVTAAAMAAAYQEVLKARTGSAGSGGPLAGADGIASSAAAPDASGAAGAVSHSPGAPGDAAAAAGGGGGSGSGSGPLSSSLPGAVAARARRNSVAPTDKVVVYVLRASPTGRLFRCVLPGSLSTQFAAPRFLAPSQGGGRAPNEPQWAAQPAHDSGSR
jgi:hypothetical protein